MIRTVTIRVIILCVILAALISIQFPLTQWKGAALNTVDNRPPVKVLFIGNSRTFANDMPFMVRKIADSAHSPKKYMITMQAPPGIALQDHWNNAQTQQLLTQKWDFVVLQGRSNEQVTDDMDRNFHLYGRQLAELARAHGSQPVLYVSWRYADFYEIYNAMPELRGTLHDRMQRSYAQLSAETGAPMVNVGRVWEGVRANYPAIPLYQDATHPTIYGSYLTALMFYRFFSGDNLVHVTYVPNGISEKDAMLLKSVAQYW